jgi:fatty acid desaturase
LTIVERALVASTLPMSIIESAREWLTALPHVQYRKDRYFYLKYDGAYAVAFAAALAWMRTSGFEPLVTKLEPWCFALMPIVLYLTILAHVFIHNASHGNFGPTFNRVVGELLGVLVFTRFASWEIIHVRHHVHSDDPAKDPHPVLPSYLRYLFRTLVSVEAQLMQTYVDQWGDTPENRRREKIRSLVSFSTGALLFACWYRLLGPVGFVLFALIPTVFALCFVVHFNWCTHNATAPNGPYHPVDQDHGYYWLGNRIFFGIYFHGIHHRRANLFNPMKGIGRFALTPATMAPPFRPALLSAYQESSLAQSASATADAE